MCPEAAEAMWTSDCAGSCVGRLDECKIGLWACFGWDEKPGAVGFEAEFCARFLDAGLEMRIWGGDVDFDGSVPVLLVLMEQRSGTPSPSALGRATFLERVDERSKVLGRARNTNEIGRCSRLLHAEYGHRVPGISSRRFV